MSALIFDCDGVLAETERHLHLPAFNRAFAEAGAPVCWSEEDYPEQLRVGGGKERMAAALGPAQLAALGLASDPVGTAALVGRMHARKTALFEEILEVGQLPARPGVVRLIHEAMLHGWTVAIVSSAAEESVRAVVRRILEPTIAESLPVFAGDAVRAKKPDPAIYELAVADLGVAKAATIVIEDSRSGLEAACAAGITCVVTVNEFYRGEEFPEAALVVSSLGDPGEPLSVIANRTALTFGDQLQLNDLAAIADQTQLRR